MDYRLKLKNLGDVVVPQNLLKVLRRFWKKEKQTLRIVKNDDNRGITK